MLFQRTIRSAISGSGIGLHTGQRTRFIMRPAPPNSGIVFVRTDLAPLEEIPAKAEQVVGTHLATTLGRNGATVQTVEHLVAALYGLGIDNIRVELDGPEVPIFDGSAAPFVALVREAGGTVAQHRPKRFLVVRRSIKVESPDKERWVRLEPARSFQVSCTVDYAHPLVSYQRFEMTVSDTAFARDVARARTFGFAKDIDAMRASGLARGGSLDNAVVVDDFSIRNPGGLRYPDEFVRHKVVDIIGDLGLIGLPLIGRYVGLRGGHGLTTQAIARLLANPRAYEILQFHAPEEAVGQALELPAFGMSGFAPA